MKRQRAAIPFLAVGLAFLALGISGRSVFLVIGLVFIILGIIARKRQRL